MVLFFLFAVLLGMAGYTVLSIRKAIDAGKAVNLPSAIKWIVSIIPAVATFATIPWTGSIITAFVIVGHLAGLLIVCDILGAICKKQLHSARPWLAAVCVLIWTVYIIGGAVNAVTVTPTFYTLTTDKELGQQSLRIAQISDVHLGTTFSAEGFEKHLLSINDCKPDLIAITGDFVDEDTDRDDMLEACNALSKVRAPLGIYYVFGNHDIGNRNFSDHELTTALEANGVTVLMDETVLVNDRVYICGRKDAYDLTRMSVEDMLDQRKSDGYTIFLDHQPREYDQYSAAGADIVLSGHTHGGQMLPLTWFIELVGMGEKTYGIEKSSDTTFIVSSGISGFEVPLRTGVKTEYVIVDIIAE